MSQTRIVVQDWLVRNNIGLPDWRSEALPNSEEKRRDEISEAVRAAVGRLDDDEHDLVERFYFMGQSATEISRLSGRPVYKLTVIQRRALRHLRHDLLPLVRNWFGINAIGIADCPLCCSEYRDEIDRFLDRRDPRSTWGQTMAHLASRFGVRIKSPQAVIGHMKNHGSRVIGRRNGDE